MNLIAINGKAGSGKDTIARIIQYLTCKEPYQVSLEEYLDQTWLHNSENSTWEIKKFAHKLKVIVSLLTGIGLTDLEKEEVKDTILLGWDKTPRFLLQFIGTDLFRNQLDSDIWVKALFKDYKALYTNNPWYDDKDIFSVSELDELIHPPQYPKWIISDMRFPNEYKAVKDRGGICIRVDRKLDNQMTHISETALENYQFDWIVDNNKDIPWLVDQVKTMLKYYKIPYNE